MIIQQSCPGQRPRHNMWYDSKIVLKFKQRTTHIGRSPRRPVDADSEEAEPLFNHTRHPSRARHWSGQFDSESWQTRMRPRPLAAGSGRMRLRPQPEPGRGSRARELRGAVSTTRTRGGCAALRLGHGARGEEASASVAQPEPEQWKPPTTHRLLKFKAFSGSVLLMHYHAGDASAISTLMMPPPALGDDASAIISIGGQQRDEQERFLGWAVPRK